MAATKVLRKISVKTVLDMTTKALRETAAKGEGSPVPLLRIAGIARRFDVGETDNGEFIRFKGDFQATNLLTGEIGISPVAFLPKPVDGLLQSQIQGDEQGHGVQFGFDILIVENETSSVGYEYRVQTLLEVKPTAPLEALLASLPPPPSIKALAAPAVTAQAVTATAHAEAAKAAKTGKTK